MIGYATLGTNDLEAAGRFYDAIAEILGARRVYQLDRFIAWQGQAGGAFMAIKPADGQPASVGNGDMVAFIAPDRAAVDNAHAKALELGGKDEGAPGPRSETTYSAYFRDPEGNKVCVFHRAS